MRWSLLSHMRTCQGSNYGLHILVGALYSLGTSMAVLFQAYTAEIPGAIDKFSELSRRALRGASIVFPEGRGLRGTPVIKQEDGPVGQRITPESTVRVEDRGDAWSRCLSFDQQVDCPQITVKETRAGDLIKQGVPGLSDLDNRAQIAGVEARILQIASNILQPREKRAAPGRKLRAGREIAKGRPLNTVGDFL
jgi:hypothetical protein